MHRIAHVSLLALAAVVLRAESARACSNSCPPAVAKPASGTLPANRAGVLVRRWNRDLVYELQKTVGTSTEAVETTVTDVDEGTVLVAPTTPWIEGEEYVLLASACTGGSQENPLPERARFTIGPSAQLPTSLGVTRVEQNGFGLVTLLGGSTCTEERDADSALVTLEPSTDAAVWQDAFVFELLVDGARFNDGTKTFLDGSAVEGPSATVFTLCDIEDPDLAEGTHVVQFRATLPGTDLSLTSEAAEIELHCDDTTGSADLADGDSSGPVADRGGGCSVSPLPAATSGVPWLLAALGALAAQRRAKRRTSLESRKAR